MNKGPAHRNCFQVFPTSCIMMSQCELYPSLPDLSRLPNLPIPTMHRGRCRRPTSLADCTTLLPTRGLSHNAHLPIALEHLLLLHLNSHCPNVGLPLSCTVYFRSPNSWVSIRLPSSSVLVPRCATPVPSHDFFLASLRTSTGAGLGDSDTAQ